jgi:hypothetical protein
MLIRVPYEINSFVIVHPRVRYHNRPQVDRTTHHTRLAFCIRIIEQRGYNDTAGQALTNANIYSIAYADGGTLTIGVPAKDRERAIKIVRADAVKHGYEINILTDNASNRSRR